MLNASRDFARLLIERFSATRCPQVAGSLTFTTLLAIVPLVTVSLALFGNFPAFKDLGDALSGFIQNNILPERAGRIVTTYALQFSEKAAQLTLIGTIMLVVTVLLLLHTIDSVFNDIWGVRTPRPLLTRLTVYWVALTVGPFALAGSIFATGRLVATSAELIGHSARTGMFSTLIVPFAMLAVLFAFLYYAVPNHPIRALHACIGGVFAAAAFMAMQRLFGTFVAGLPTYTLVYGTFAALPIFLAWLYMSWIVVLLGALVAATLPGFLSRTTRISPFPGDRAWAATSVLTRLAGAQRRGHAVPFDELRATCGGSDDMVETILGEMREQGWVARTDEHAWVLAIDPAQLTIQAVVRHFALNPEAWLRHANPCGTRHAAELLEAAMRSADITLEALSALQDAGQSATPAHS